MRGKHQLVTSCACLDQGRNPQPRYALTENQTATFWFAKEAQTAEPHGPGKPGPLSPSAIVDPRDPLCTGLGGDVWGGWQGFTPIPPFPELVLFSDNDKSNKPCMAKMNSLHSAGLVTCGFMTNQPRTAISISNNC